MGLHKPGPFELIFNIYQYSINFQYLSIFQWDYTNPDLLSSAVAAFGENNKKKGLVYLFILLFPSVSSGRLSTGREGLAGHPVQDGLPFLFL
tara:strand:+ start:99 stop:374 length:276 start_codon:yes stop_codon:yes gene_type:complete